MSIRTPEADPTHRSRLTTPAAQRRLWLDAAPETAIVLAGAMSVVAILTVLLVTVPRSDAATSTFKSLREMARNAQLFHEILPTAVVLPSTVFAVIAWSCVAFLWVVYVPLCLGLTGRPLDFRATVTWTAGFALLGLAIPPVFSTDLFSYALFGRLAAVYGLNPYLATAADLPRSDALLPYLYWRDISSPYGPLWTIVSAVVAAGDDATPLELALRFKLLPLGASVLSGWLVYRLVQERWPADAAWAYLAFAWNPLVLVEGLIAGHNDTVVLVLLLTGAWFVSNRRPAFGVLCLTASALIKYSTLPIVGLALLTLVAQAARQRRPGLSLRLGGTALGLVSIAFAPFWAGLDVLASTLDEPGRGINNLLILAIGRGVSEATGGRIEALAPANAVGMAVVLFLLWLLLSFRRQLRSLPSWTVHDQLAAWSQLLLAFLAMWPRIHTWYFLVPIGLALASGPIGRRTFWVATMAAIASYTSYLL